MGLIGVIFIMYLILLLGIGIRKFRINKKIFYKDPFKIFKNNKIDILIEAIGQSDGISKKIVEFALKNKIHVVTPNKALISKHGNNLSKLAEKNRVNLEFEASVGGGIPILRTIKEGLATNKISKVFGILNGTCNYILTTMRETGRDFNDVLEDAQKLGYAEADPSFDIDGIDAAHKLAILTSIAFQTRINFDSVHTEGIRFIAPIDLELSAELGFRIKLLGIAEKKFEGIQQRVRPCLVPINSPIAQVEGVFNAVAAEGDGVGLSLSFGRGAGAGPTASSVIADILDMASNRITPNFGVNDHDLVDGNPIKVDCLEGSYYLRLKVVDRPGVLADLTAIFRDKNVSVEAMLQRGRDPEELVPVVLTTHETSESSILSSIKEFQKLDSVAESPKILPIENFTAE